MACENRDRINLAQARVQWQTLTSIRRGVRFPDSADQLSASKGRRLLHAVASYAGIDVCRLS